MICSFCNNKIFLKTIIKYSISQKKNIKYYECSNCQSLQQYPIPDNKIIKNYYENYKKIKKDLNPGYLDYRNILILFKERDKTLSEIGFNKNWIKNTTNVEFGCANGQFLHYLNKNGANKIIGLDISKKLIKNINKINKKQIKIIVGELSKLKADSIDNLFMFNILEHITDINSLMKHVITTVKKDGKIIIEVPLVGIISKGFKEKWRFLMPDEHLHIPSLKGLDILIKRYGLKIIGKTRFGSGYTVGMISPFLKIIFDKFAKTFSYGDRGSFLIIFDKIKN